MSMRHYPKSLAMRYANAKAQAALIEFMTAKFLPVWKAEILQYMDTKGVDILDQAIALEEIHLKLYLGQGFAEEENRIFQAQDPVGFKKFMDASSRTLVENGNVK